MEEALRKLKKAMDDTTFNQVQFHQGMVEHIEKNMSREQLEIAILQLVNSKKTGTEVTQLLHVKMDHQIAKNEGLIYIILHELVAKQFIERIVMEEAYYYEITKKGSKYLVGQAQSSTRKSSALQRLLGGKLNVQ